MPETSKFEKILSKGNKRHWGEGGVTTPALRTLGPHLSWYIEINGYLPSQLNSPPLSASRSHSMLLEDRQQAADQGRWETPAKVQD